MPDVQLQHLDYHTKQDPRLGETLRQIQSILNNLAGQTATTPEGLPDAPAPPTSIKVTASGGIFEIAITDNNPSQTGVAPDYYVEYSTTPNFAAPVQVFLGPARNQRTTLGNVTLYWRCYSQFGRASQASAKVYFGSVSSPTPVVGGGATSGPAPLPSQGSGTTPTNGQTGGEGYGPKTVRQNPGRRELK